MRRILISWRFCVALALLLLVAWLVWSGYEAQQQRARDEARVDALIGLLEKQRTADDAERQYLLAAQARSLNQLAALRAQEYRLLEWLRRQGVTAPEAVLVSPPRPRPAAHHPQHHVAGHPKPSPAPGPPASPTATPAPTTTPAPVKGKGHPKHHHPKGKR